MKCCGTKKTLANLKCGCRGRIRENECDYFSKKRFQEMGLTEGSIISVVRTAPLGDPIIIKIRNYEMILRKNECRKIFVEDEND